MSQFDGLHVVVTGGTGALGTAVVERLLAEGARVHVPVRKLEDLARFRSHAHPRLVVEGGVELADESAVEAFYANVPSLFASIHVAGGFAMAPLLETSGAMFQALLATNATSAFLCCREATRRIRATSPGGGRLVNVAAKPALVPTAGMAAYAASKAVVASLTVSLAEELHRDGIWVNAVVPSIFDTPANRAAMPKADHRLWPSVADVASTIVFLASPANTATRGALVPVYGRS